MNDHVEDRMREALAPVEAPEGFAERVLARARAEAAPPSAVAVVRLRPRRFVIAWAGVAAAAALALATMTSYYVATPLAPDAPQSGSIVGPTSDGVPLAPPASGPVGVDAPAPLPAARGERDGGPSRRRTAQPASARRRPPRAPEDEPQVRAEARRAKEQLLRALSITNDALDTVKRTVATDEGEQRAPGLQPADETSS